MKTLKELSKETGISVEMIEQIERGIENMKSGVNFTKFDHDAFRKAAFRKAANRPSTLNEFYESLEWHDVDDDIKLISGMVVVDSLGTYTIIGSLIEFGRVITYGEDDPFIHGPVLMKYAYLNPLMKDLK